MYSKKCLLQVDFLINTICQMSIFLPPSEVTDGFATVVLLSILSGTKMSHGIVVAQRTMIGKK